MYVAKRTSKLTNAVRSFFGGVGLLGRGIGVWRTAPGLMALGLIPSFAVAVAFTIGIVALGLNIESIAITLTPFANDWPEPFYTAIHITAGLAFLVVAILFVVNAFTTVTLAVGQPIYERIWRHVEQAAGSVPNEARPGFWRALGRAVGDGLRMLLPTLLIGLALFVVGFIPAVGPILAPLLGACAGGWFLTIELSGLAFDARGFAPRARRAALASQRSTTLGFGLASYLLYLVPLGAIFAMPAAVAGATMLAQRIGSAALNEPDRNGS